MKNAEVESIKAQSRKLTVGQIVDLIISGELRKESGMDKRAFSNLIAIDRKTLRTYEDWAGIPNLSVVFNIAQTFNFKLPMKKAE
ncbi:helix-turn-helix domain-containing protein [Serratia quinivorans]